eukprot:6197452-Pleurochrysis_carterae.AAC.2
MAALLREQQAKRTAADETRRKLEAELAALRTSAHEEQKELKDRAAQVGAAESLHCTVWQRTLNPCSSFMYLCSDAGKPSGTQERLCRAYLCGSFSRHLQADAAHRAELAALHASLTQEQLACAQAQQAQQAAAAAAAHEREELLRAHADALRVKEVMVNDLQAQARSCAAT